MLAEVFPPSEEFTSRSNRRGRISVLYLLISGYKTTRKRKNVLTLPHFVSVQMTQRSTQLTSLPLFLHRLWITMLSNWPSGSPLIYLQVNEAKTQTMSLGKSQFTYHLSVEDQIIGIEPTLKILGVTLDKDLSYKPHVDTMLKELMLKLWHCVK